MAETGVDRIKVTDFQPSVLLSRACFQFFYNKGMIYAHPAKTEEKKL